MYLITYCNSCKAVNNIKSSTTTRPELEKEKGEEFNIQCTECLTSYKIHVNDVKATENTTILFGGIIMAIVITIFLWTFLGAIGTISIAVPILIWRSQSNSVHAFNRYLIKRR